MNISYQARGGILILLAIVLIFAGFFTGHIAFFYVAFPLAFASWLTMLLGSACSPSGWLGNN